LILASASPRRRSLLRDLGVPFQVVRPRVDESIREPVAASGLVRCMAARKARAVARRRRQGVVLAADTVVVVDGRPLGKPKDRTRARTMLHQLRGRPHTVLTGVHVVNARSGRQAAGISRSRVWMRPATNGAIEAYLRSGEPLDKAGAYAIQGKGATLVARYHGPYDNIVGLPLHLVRRLLGEVGFQMPARRRRGPDARAGARVARRRSRRPPAGDKA
jgi:septum formation protein